MRIDKYLWCIRYYKTRSIASNAVKKGHVKVNGSAVKPSRDVYPMDKIVVRKNQIDHQLTVLDIPETRVGAKLVDIYRKDTTLDIQRFAARQRLTHTASAFNHTPASCVQ